MNLRGIDKEEKRHSAFHLMYYAIVFGFLMVFFAKIHPIMIFDSDDWGCAAFRRRAIPLWGIWNPTRILPEVLMPMCSSIGIHLVYPLIGDISWSTTLVYAAVVSGFIVVYLYALEQFLIKKAKLPRMVAIWVDALFLLMHFWCFRVNGSGNEHLFFSSDACIYFYYIIPAVLNASLVLLMEMNKEGFQHFSDSKDYVKMGALVLAIYFGIFSNMFGSQILSIYAGVRIVSYIHNSLSRETKKKGNIVRSVFRKCTWESIIIIVWLMTLLWEINGGRATGSLAHKSIANALKATCYQLVYVWQKMNKTFIAFSVLSVIAAVGLLFFEKDKREVREIINTVVRFAVCFMISGLYVLLLCAAADRGIHESYILLGIMIWILWIDVLLIAYVLKKYPMLTVAMPLMLVILIFEIDTEYITFRDPNYGNIPGWKCAAVNKVLIEQIAEAEHNKEDALQLYVPKFGSEDNWPLADYAVYDITRTLHKYGLINRIHSGVVIPVEDFYERYGIN